MLEEETVSCLIICNKKLKLDEYVDHILECEKILEKCERCGPKYLKYDIHRAPGYHSTVTQRFNCTGCVDSMGKRVSIAKNHKITCQGQGSGRFIYTKSVEYAQTELWNGYTKDIKVREILEDDFNKRAKIHSHKRQNQINLIKTILAIIGIMITIYMATYIITQAARQNTNSREKLPKQYIKNIGPTTNNVNNQVNNLHPNKKKKSKNKLNNREKVDKGSEAICQTDTHKKDLEENWGTKKKKPTSTRLLKLYLNL